MLIDRLQINNKKPIKMAVNGISAQGYVNKNKDIVLGNIV